MQFYPAAYCHSLTRLRSFRRKLPKRFCVFKISLFSRFLLTNRQLSSIYEVIRPVRMTASTQRRPWFFIAFVLAILLSLGFRPDRPTRVFLDSPGGRASYLDLSHTCVPAVKPTKFSLHLEEGGKAAHDERLTSLSALSLDDAPLHTIDTGPPLSDLHGPPVLDRTAPRLKLQGLPVPPARKAGGNYPPNPRKPGLRQESGFCNM